ncbi:MAG TPA: hypothetical protein VLG46_07695 [Anaerolineae bacterium]|nr:hypothetical protein [Anaerolineae bacterium]
MKKGRNMFRKISTVFLLTLLLLAVGVGVSYAAELVANGNFSQLTGSQPTHWTPWAGDSIVADSSGVCGSGVATVQGLSIATAQQCIHITSPGSNWTFSLDMGVYDSSYSAAVANFFTSADCSGTYVHQELSPMASSPTMQHYSRSFTYDTAANGVNSVMVGIETARMVSVNVTGCFDNVSLNATGATVIALRRLSAVPVANASGPIALGGVAGLIFLAVSVILLWRKR